MSGVTTVRRSPAEVRLDPPDGVPRFGILALATDLTSERDAARVIGAERAALHVARVAYENPTTPENLRRMGPRLTAAAELLVPEVPLAAILYSCTAASVEIGDAAVAEAIGRARPGVPVVTPPGAVVEAFRALGLRRIALVTPYLPETTAPVLAYLRARGLGVESAHCLSIADDRDIARVSRDTIVEAALAADRPEAQGIFLSCTALPTLDLVADLEARLGKPVVSSNLASLWRLCHHGGIAPLPGTPGRLFGAAPREQAA